MGCCRKKKYLRRNRISSRNAIGGRCCRCCTRFFAGRSFDNDLYCISGIVVDDPEYVQNCRGIPPLCISCFCPYVGISCALYLRRSPRCNVDPSDRIRYAGRRICSRGYGSCRSRSFVDNQSSCTFR